jgi:hypothetical protein
VEPWQDLGRWVPALDGSDEAAVVLDASIFSCRKKNGG